jgi:hypothetical protein
MINQHTDHDAFANFAQARRWVSWRSENRNGKATKVPYCANGMAKSNDPKTWMLRGEAEAIARSKGHNGIGIQLGSLDEDEHLIGLDLDSCRDPATGEIKEWARRAVETIGSYAEVSPSQTGLKIFALASASVIDAIRASLTPGGAITWKGGTGEHPPCIDLYTAGRYFTVTGLHFDGTPSRPQHVSEAQLRTLINEIGPLLTGKKDRRPASDEKDERSQRDPAQSGWEALVAWASSGNSRDQINALQLIAGGTYATQHDKSHSGCEFAFAGVCKAAGLTEAQYFEAMTEWAARGFGYGRGDSRSIHDRQRAWHRCWANGKTVQEWPDPEPLDIDEGTPAEFPLDALPLMMREAAADIIKATKCPAALAGASVMAASSFAVQNHFDVAFKGGMERPVSLMILTIAASGERKSTVDSFALEGVREYQKAKRREHAAREKNILEEKKAGIEPSPSLPEPTAILANATLQGIFRTFHEGQPSLALFSDEGGEFLGGHSMKAENRLGSMAGLSKFWDGTDQSYKLRGTAQKSETLYARAPRLAVHLQAQPVAMMPFLSDPVARGQGILARMLMHKPSSTIGKRFQTYEEWIKPSRTVAIQSFALRIHDMAGRPYALSDEGGVRRTTIPLQPEADLALWHYAEEIEKHLAPAGDLSGLSDLVNKLPEQAARIAGVFAAFDGQGTVTRRTMEDAIAVASYFLSETVRLARLAPQEEGLADAMAIARWLKARGGRETNTNLNNGLPVHLRRKKAREKPVRLLEEAAWIRKDGNSWMLNPKIPANWLSAAKADEGA